MNKKMDKAAVIALVLAAVIFLLAGAIWTVAYLRTGQQYYDEENLETCLHYSNEQAKETVLQAWLYQQQERGSGNDSQKAADESDVTFMEDEIQGPDKIWLVPFTVSSKPGKKQFGMLDCGTLTVEFSGE